ncbi:1-phosphatidylinositol 3-phosphate 5-kinase-like [Ornithodoros turicata]
MEASDVRRRAKKLDSPTSLTEFAPLSSDVKTKGGGFSLSKLFRISRPPRDDDAAPDLNPQWDTIPEHDVLQPCGTPAEPTNITHAGLDVSSATSTADMDVLYTRSFSGVLSRIAHIMDRGIVAPNASCKDSDLKQYWMPDSNCKECYECGDKFTTFRRRHHCRICGQIFCSRCCNREIPGKIIGYRGDLRVCMYCCQVVLSYVNSLDLSADLRGVLADLQSKLGVLRMEGEDAVTSDSWRAPASRRKTSLGFREEALVLPKADEYASSDSTAFRSPSPGHSPAHDILFIRELWSQIQHPTHGVVFQTHRRRLHTYQNCVVGNELVDWLVAQGKASSRSQAVSVGQAFLDECLLESVTSHESVFLDSYALYKPIQTNEGDASPAASSPNERTEETQDPLWVSEIQPEGSLSREDSPEPEKLSSDQFEVSYKDHKRLTTSTSTFFLNLDLKESRVTVSRPRDATSPDGKCDERRHNRWEADNNAVGHEICNRTINDDCISGALFASSRMNDSVDQKLPMDDEVDTNEVREKLHAMYNSLEKDLLKQLLTLDGVSLDWCDVILPIVHTVSALVSPDTKCEEDMDIRSYVHVKKIPGGSRVDSCVVSGTVCTKNIVHKKMRQQLTNPRILLVGSSIVYQRIENKFSSLDPILMQECEYLKHVVAKIQVFEPDLLLVEKTVSRLAQEKLLQMDVTLATNMKPSVMERISRCTQSTIVSSIDAQLHKPNLGTCQNFYVKTYILPANRTKTLLFFDGCPSRLGCTILLRGGTSTELGKVKRIILFMLYVAYNWRLELSFLMNEHAEPPADARTLREEDCDVSQSDSKKEPENKVNMEDVKVEDTAMNIEKCIVEDFSDPLHTLLNSEDSAEPLDDHLLIVKKQSSTSSFELALNSTVLCCSPYIKPTLPYLKTEAGQSCELRKFFDDEIYWSPKTSDVETASKRFGAKQGLVSTVGEQDVQETVTVAPPHPFTLLKLTSSEWDSGAAQALLADFRARGGRIQVLCQHNRNWNVTKSARKALHSEAGQRNYGGESRIDALSAYNHQRIAVLFCSYSPTSSNAPYFCVNLSVVNMDFYGHYDIPLGGFLERYCFGSSYTCPNYSCDTPMLEHVRKFVHENGSIQVLLHHLDNPLPSAQNSTLMWSWCRKCRFVTPLTVMSQETWSFSFAKYLELRFHGYEYGCRSPHGQCPHSLHHDHYQYFASEQIVASFKYSPVQIREVAFPSPVIAIVDEIPKVSVIVDEIRELAVKGSSIYSAAVEALYSLKEQVQGTKHESTVTELMEKQQTEKSAFKEMIESIQLQLTSPTLKRCQSQNASMTDSVVLQEARAMTWKIYNSIVQLKQYMAEAVCTWNKRLQEFEVMRKREERSQTRTLSKQAPAGVDANVSVEEPKQELVDSTDAASSFGDSDSQAGDDVLAAGNIQTGGQTSVEAQGESQLVEDLERTHALHSSLQTANSSTSMSSYMYSVSPGIYAGLMGQDLNAAKSERYGGFHPEDNNESGKRCGSIRTHERSRSDGAEKLQDNRSKLQTPSLSKPDDEASVGKLEKRGTVKTIISQLLSSSGTSPIQSPFPASDHFNVSHGSRIPVIIHDQEPSSIIAHALASADYELKLLELQSNLTAALNQLREQASSMGKRDSGSDVQCVDFEEFVLCNSQETEKKTGSKSFNMHIDTQFSDATSQFYCRVFFAEQFRKLRRFIFPHGEDRFIYSLLRCVSWSAQGGKSGLSFCKTHDDRFILKQMSRYEVQSFLEFAPRYFQYVSNACIDRQPTVLAKIVGVFRIGCKNSATNTASKLDLLVMENLFYGRNIAQKFDLKGSVRNRLVNTRSQAEGDVVLLDENLLKMTCDSPLYVRPHSKTVLTLAIKNDAKFLWDNLVIDYSLLVGFDNDRKELVVGIIDYIRTFTWDKKLEMVVKSTVTLRGHKKQPTIISPDLYHGRFCEAMDKYFLCVPDCWSGLGSGINC